MILNYKTGKLPLNFIYLGIMFLFISIWRLIVFDWVGIVLLVISLLCLFLKTGIIIDSDNKRIKKYIDLFSLKNGQWEDISTFQNLQIVKKLKTQNMNFISISRTETNEVFILYLILPGKKIELLNGEIETVSVAAKEISEALQAKVNVKFPPF